jgi:L-lactate dehydrogenase complex protein LldG
MSELRGGSPPRPGASATTTGHGHDLLDRFRTKVEAASAGFHELDGWDEVVELVVGLADSIAVAPSLAASRPDLVDALETAGVRVVVPDGDDPAAAVADVPVAIVAGQLAIAETGSVLVSEHALGDRVVTMLCHRLVQVVGRDQLAPRLDDAAQWLAARKGEPGFASLMTGPSRTADIERSLTIGVQGPDEVDVVVLGRPDGPDDPSTGAVTSEADA